MGELSRSPVKQYEFWPSRNLRLLIGLSLLVGDDRPRAAPGTDSWVDELPPESVRVGSSSILCYPCHKRQKPNTEFTNFTYHLTCYVEIKKNNANLRRHACPWRDETLRLQELYNIHHFEFLRSKENPAIPNTEQSWPTDRIIKRRVWNLESFKNDTLKSCLTLRILGSHIFGCSARRIPSTTYHMRMSKQWLARDEEPIMHALTQGIFRNHLGQNPNRKSHLFGAAIRTDDGRSVS